jgi:hypothetical protein
MKKPVCSICLLNVKEKQNHITFACGHIFHTACVFDWVTNPHPQAQTHRTLKNRPTCPNCRAEIKPQLTKYVRECVRSFDEAQEDLKRGLKQLSEHDMLTTREYQMWVLMGASNTATRSKPFSKLKLKGDKELIRVCIFLHLFRNKRFDTKHIKIWKTHFLNLVDQSKRLEYVLSRLYGNVWYNSQKGFYDVSAKANNTHLRNAISKVLKSDFFELGVTSTSSFDEMRPVNFQFYKKVMRLDTKYGS